MGKHQAQTPPTQPPHQPLWTPLHKPHEDKGKAKGTPSRLPPNIVKRLSRARPGEPSFVCEDCKAPMKLKTMREWKSHHFAPAHLICKWCWEIRCGDNLAYEKELRKVNRRKS